MTINTEDLLNSIMESFDRIGHISSGELPNIDLYMDQVTTFMDKKLKNTTRRPGEDKILTKTMINNYAKNRLLPPPEKKKYSRNHMLMLLFIYYFKGIMTIQDIQMLLKPLAENHFSEDAELSLEDLYEEVFSLENQGVQALKKDISQKFEAAQKTFQDAPEGEEEFLRTFSFICMLSFDVYIKKLLIEKMIDGMLEEPKRDK